MDVSVIIVNYNTCKLLSNCLETVYKYTSGLEYEIIIVDNDSSDDSKEIICKKYSEVKWIDAGNNLGFGRANNLGAQYATGKYLFLLNSDTLLFENSIKQFFDILERDETNSIGCIGGELLDQNKEPNSSFGYFPSIANENKYLFCRTKVQTNIHREQPYDVDYIIGADLFMRRQLFQDLNGFDSNFFMYYEETDLQKRVSELGLKRMIFPSVRIIHLEGGSFEKKGLSPNRFRMAQTSFNYYIRKHYSGLSYLMFRIYMIVNRLTIFMSTWSLKDKIKAYSIVLLNKSL